MPLNPKQVEEVNWWRNFFRSMGPEGFLNVRREDWEVTLRYLPEINAARGRGLDLGCGPLSILECSRIRGVVYAADALLDEYRKILPSENRRIQEGPEIRYFKSDGEGLPFRDGYFDWVLCRNVIDHTPNPAKMIAEIRRVLKPGKRLYFEVNFDQILGTAHYDLWNRDSVRNYFDGFRVAVERIQDKPEYRQQGFWAVLLNQKKTGWKSLFRNWFSG